MKINQLIKTDQTSNRNMISETQQDEYTAVDSIVDDIIDKYQHVSISNTHVTSLGNLSTYFERHSSSTSVSLEMWGLPLLSSLKGLPRDINDLSISGCNNITDWSDLNNCDRINSLNILKCDNLHEIDLAVKHLETTIVFNENKNLTKLTIGPSTVFDLCDFHITDNHKLELLEFDANQTADSVFICGSPKLFDNFANSKINCNTLLLGVSDDIRFTDLSNIRCEKLILKPNKSKFGKIYGMSNIVKMTQHGLAEIDYPNSSSQDMAFNILKQIIEDSGNMRVKLMKFTQMMSDAGLDEFV